MQSALVRCATFGLSLFLIIWCVALIPAWAKVHTAPDNYKEKCAVCHGDDGSGKTAAQQRSRPTELPDAADPSSA